MTVTSRRLAATLRRAAGVVCAFGLALALGVAVPLPAALHSGGEGTSGEGPGGEETGGERGEAVRILVLAGPIHTDIALPTTPEVRRRFGFLGEAGLPISRPDAAYVVVGWGGRSFYLKTPTWADVTPGPLFRSFTVDASVLHVELAGAIAPGAPGVRSIDLGGAAFEALLGVVDRTLSRDASGRPIPIEGSGYGDFDRFFEAEGAFNALAGCNVWTARALRAAGIATGVWTPLPQTLLWSLDLHG